MTLLNHEKWALVRSKGKRAFVRWFALRLGFSFAFVMSLVYVWAGHRLYSASVFTVAQAVGITVVVIVLLFLLSPVVFWVCGELSWRLSERDYHRHVETGHKDSAA